jgi:ABC-2 type transport system ATP-binding protein
MTSSNRPIALALRGVSKSFDRPAVDALDLTIFGGEFYALVRPNGAGKTTTLRMVVGLLKPDAGSISIGAIDALTDPVAAKQITAWLSDEPMIYDKLTPYEYLEFVAGLWRIDPAVAQARAARRTADRSRRGSARGRSRTCCADACVRVAPSS